MSSIPIAAESNLSPSAHTHTAGEEWEREVRGMTVRELREKYPGEATTYARILASAKRGECEVHPEFRPFKSFMLHVGPKGDPTRTLDRINPADRVYGPGKVRWATPREQANNRLCTITLRGSDGRVRPLTEWAKITGQNPDTMRKRLARGGWTQEEVVAGRKGVASSSSPDAEPASPVTRLPVAAHWFPNHPALVELFPPGYLRRCHDVGEAWFKSLPPASRRGASKNSFVEWLLNRHLELAEQEVRRLHPNIPADTIIAWPNRRTAEPERLPDDAWRHLFACCKALSEAQALLDPVEGAYAYAILRHPTFMREVWEKLHPETARSW